MNNKLIGKRIKTIRKKNGLNQANFAKKAGITQSTLSSYKNGNATPSIDVLWGIASEFNISTDWILGLSQAKTSISNLTDVAAFILQLDDISELRYELDVHGHLKNDTETENNRWYTSLTFYGNDTDHPANHSLCFFLEALEENRDSFESYFCSKESYDQWKQTVLDGYYDSILSKRE